MKKNIVRVDIVWADKAKTKAKIKKTRFGKWILYTPKYNTNYGEVGINYKNPV